MIDERVAALYARMGRVVATYPPHARCGGRCVSAGSARRFCATRCWQIRPRVIATLGSPAMLVLKAASEDLRGRWHGYTTLRALDGAQPSAALAGHVRFGSRWSCAASWRWDTPVLGPARASIAAGAGRAPMRLC